MAKQRNFRRGRSTFNCICCHRLTREVDQGGTDLCQECFEICGLDNTVNDNSYDPTEYLPEAERLLAKIAKRGGDVEAVKRQNSFLWRAK